jgi:hypothetical protein
MTKGKRIRVEVEGLKIGAALYKLDNGEGVRAVVSLDMSVKGRDAIRLMDLFPGVHTGVIVFEKTSDLPFLGEPIVEREVIEE